MTHSTNMLKYSEPKRVKQSFSISAKIKLKCPIASTVEISKTI